MQKFIAQKSYCACHVLSLATIRSKYYFNFILNKSRSGRELFDRLLYIKQWEKLWIRTGSLVLQTQRSGRALECRPFPASEEAPGPERQLHRRLRGPVQTSVDGCLVSAWTEMDQCVRWPLVPLQLSTVNNSLIRQHRHMHCTSQLNYHIPGLSWVGFCISLDTL